MKKVTKFQGQKKVTNDRLFLLYIKPWSSTGINYNGLYIQSQRQCNIILIFNEVICLGLKEPYTGVINIKINKLELNWAQLKLGLEFTSIKI